MRIDSRSGIRGKLYADNGDGQFRRVPRPIWYDDATCEYQAFRVDGNEEIVTKPHTANPSIRVPVRLPVQKAFRLFFEPNEKDSQIASLMQPDPFRASANGVKYHKDHPCQVPTCIRPGIHSYATTVEEQLPSPDGFVRARLRKIQYFCDWHYQSAKLVDANGEEIKQFDDVRVRPQ